jgi:2-polyprenyl-6-methoxyphenol hydroxylase-like FAD-dependent oxidoreductase
MTDTVIISGAGPAGLMLACELGLAGVRSVVVERDAEPRVDAPGVAINPATIELLDQRGLMDELREGALVLPTEHFGFVFLDATQLGRPHENTHLVLQPRIERTLERRAVELGAEILRGRELVELREDEDGVTVTLRTSGGSEVLRGRYLVGCDGANSTVRRLTGIGFPGVSAPFHGIVGDIEIDHSEIAPELIGVHHLPSGGHFLGAPTEPGIFRAMLAEFGVESPAADTPVDLEELRESVLRITGAELKSDRARWLSRYPNDTRNAERYAQGRVFLAGDAAHVHYPFNGKGIGTGIHDAQNLGWKLAATLHGWAPGGLLETYHAERHPVGQEACDTVRAQVSLCYPPEAVAPLRDLLGRLARFDDVRKYLVATVTGMGVRYPVGEDAHPLTGLRLPHTELTTSPGGPAKVPALLHGGRGLLLDLTGGGLGLHTSEVAGLENRIDTVIAQPSPDIEARAVLLRPDGHVAWAVGDGGSEDVAGLSAAVRTWFGSPAEHSA